MYLDFTGKSHLNEPSSNIKNSAGLFNKGYTVGWFYGGRYFRMFSNYYICFVVAICDLVHDEKAIHGLC